MSIFNDDFYSAKVSKRVVKQIGKHNYSSNKKVFGLFNRSSFQIALITSITTAVIVTVLFTIFIGFGNKEQLSNTDLSERTILASSKVRPAVVSIVNEQKFSLGLNSKPLDEYSTENGVYKDTSVGSGVIVSKDETYAYIVTNYHVLEKAQKIRVALTSGEQVYAEVVGKDKISDIAVIKIPAEGVTEIAELGDSSTLQSAEFVLAMGNPLGRGESTTLGIISVKSEIIGVALEYFGVIDWEQEVIRVDAAINQGNSGGPLINMNGQVVGINSMKITDIGVESIGYALPINNVKPIVNQLVSQGYVSRPYLGVYTKDFALFLQQQRLQAELNAMNEESDGNDQEDEEEQFSKHILDGLIVYEAVGPAKKAGLQFHDVIVQLDDTEIKNNLDFRRYLYSKKEIGDEMVVHFYRGNEKKSVKVTLEDNKPGN